MEAVESLFECLEQVPDPRRARLTGVCMGFSCRGMAGDLQVGFGFRPRLRQQPHPAPEPSLMHQLVQPVDAVPDYADCPPRPAPTTAVCAPAPLEAFEDCLGRVLRSKASSTLVSYARVSIAATGSTSQCREIRAGSVLRVLCHCHPALLTALNPASIQNRSAYQLMPAWSGGRPVNMVHGPSCSTYQTAINVQRRFSVALLNAVPVPIHPVPAGERRFVRDGGDRHRRRR